MHNNQSKISLNSFSNSLALKTNKKHNILKASLVLSYAICCSLGLSTLTNSANANSITEKKISLFVRDNAVQQQSLFNQIKTKADKITVDNELSIIYGDWNKILEGTVLYKGPSSRTRANTIAAPVGTRFIRANKKNTRLEANRVMFHLLKDAEKQYVHGVKRSLEHLPDQMSLGYFTKNEQLAHWLNIRNITMYEAIMDQYPIPKLKKFLPKIKAEKRLTIEGVSLSINDIEAMIIKNWPRQHVIYGFWDGTIGGPNIRERAFTGKLVWDNLADNAQEFMNSLRGVQFMGKTAKISIFYENFPSLFPDLKTDVRKHFRLNIKPALVKRLSQTNRIRFNVSDWNIADLMNGRLGLASAAMTGPGPLVNSNSGGKNTNLTYMAGIGNKGMDNLRWLGFPLHVQQYLKGIRARRVKAKTIIHIEEMDTSKKN